MTEPLIYEMSVPGRCGVEMPDPDVPLTELPAERREHLPLPEVSQLDLVRHYVRLSRLNFSIDSNFYPLGSCTMKYNPKINEQVARLTGFTLTHPLQSEDGVQGNLFIMSELQEYLREIADFAAASLQPAAGAQGELSGVLMMRAYHLDREDVKRTRVLVPDSAHGTNPATTAMAGLQVVEIPSDPRGNVDLEKLRAQCDDTVVGMMLTNPNTLGLYDEHIEEICATVHACGGLMYGDGANMNALLGIAKPGQIGFDVMHYNLHKTFSTPHGGGGPGSGPVVCTEALAPFLPGPIVVKDEELSDEHGDYYTLMVPEKSIGPIKSFYGNFGMFVRAYTYIRVNGPEGLRAVSEYAVLNANYLQARLKDVYPIPHGDRLCMHEFVAEGHVPDAPGIRALDISKRLMDYGIHPPTNYFPLIVHEALMIEPTETESKETLDYFVEAMTKIAEEARADPDLVHSAPHNTPAARLDEVRAAKELVLSCGPGPTLPGEL